MNRKLIVLLFLSFGINAFQENFETVVKFSKDDNEVDKIIASKPFGYCLLDGIPMSFCQTMTINLFGGVFRKYALDPNLPTPNSEQRVSEIVKKNYQLGVDDATYDVPTAGQLVSLIDNEIISNNQACYWIKVGEEEYRPAGYIASNCTPENAKLNYLVTPSSPAVCADIDDYCNLNAGKQIKIRLKSAANLRLEYIPTIRILYRNGITGRQTTLDTPTISNMNEEITLPLNSESVTIFYMVQGGIDGFKQRESELDKRDSDCFEIMTRNFYDPNLVEKLFEYDFKPCPDE